MENDDDRKLREALQAWRVPGAPRSLDERVGQLRETWWRVLFTGSIRVPIPVGLAIAALVLVLGGALMVQKREAAPLSPSLDPRSIDLVGFRPVADVNVRVIPHHELR